MAGVLACSLSALAATGIVPADTLQLDQGDSAAARAAPVLKLRLFFGGLALVSGAALVLPHALAPLYGAVLVFLAGTPALGHQAIGMTPVRRESTTHRIVWAWSVAYLPIALTMAVVAFARLVG